MFLSTSDAYLVIASAAWPRQLQHFLMMCVTSLCGISLCEPLLLNFPPLSQAVAEHTLSPSPKELEQGEDQQEHHSPPFVSLASTQHTKGKVAKKGGGFQEWKQECGEKSVCSKETRWEEGESVQDDRSTAVFLSRSSQGRKKEAKEGKVQFVIWVFYV